MPSPGLPDPAKAVTAADYVGALNALRIWAGSPSLRRLRELGGVTTTAGGDRIDALPPSTVSRLLNGQSLPGLPRLDFVRAFVTACLTAGALPAEQASPELARWIDQWRRIATDDGLERPTAAAERVPAPAPFARTRRHQLLGLPPRLLAGLAALIGIALLAGVLAVSWPEQASSGPGCDTPVGPHNVKIICGTRTATVNWYYYKEDNSIGHRWNAFAIGTDHRVWTTHQNEKGAWRPWRPIAGTWASKAVYAYLGAEDKRKTVSTFDRNNKKQCWAWDSPSRAYIKWECE
jgi:hypothetical protein